METKSFESKVKEQAIRDHFRVYQRALQEIIARGEDVHDLILHDFCSDIDKTELESIFVNIGQSLAKMQIIRTLVAMNSLSDEDRIIIKEEFIRPNNKRWWEKEFTRSKYYRIRNKAIDNFFALIS